MRDNFIRRSKILLESKSGVNLALIFNNQIVTDFASFKEKNELQYCTMRQSDLTTNSMTATFSTTIKYTMNEFDQSKIMEEFEKFCEINKKQYCTITKLVCQENNYIVEFSVERDYMVVQ